MTIDLLSLVESVLNITILYERILDFDVFPFDLIFLRIYSCSVLSLNLCIIFSLISVNILNRLLKFHCVVEHSFLSLLNLSN